jgi:hypothetical protein
MYISNLAKVKNINIQKDATCQLPLQIYDLEAELKHSIDQTSVILETKW